MTAKLSFVFHGFLCMKKQCGLRGRLIGQGYMSGIKGCGSSGSLNAARGVGKLLEISGRWFELPELSPSHSQHRAQPHMTAKFPRM